MKKMQPQGVDLLFSDGLMKVDMTALSKATGITRSALYRYKSNPYMIPLKNLILICNARGLTEEERARVIR